MCKQCMYELYESMYVSLISFLAFFQCGLSHFCLLVVLLVLFLQTALCSYVFCVFLSSVFFCSFFLCRDLICQEILKLRGSLQSRPPPVCLLFIPSPNSALDGTHLDVDDVLLFMLFLLSSMFRRANFQKSAILCTELIYGSKQAQSTWLE